MHLRAGVTEPLQTAYMCSNESLQCRSLHLYDSASGAAVGMFLQVDALGLPMGMTKPAIEGIMFCRTVRNLPLVRLCWCFLSYQRTVGKCRSIKEDPVLYIYCSFKRCGPCSYRML